MGEPLIHPDAALAEAARILHQYGCTRDCTGDPSTWRENAQILLDAVVPLLGVFREEEVRPLWEAARGLYGLDVWKAHTEAIDAFPAPEEWTARADDEPEEDREPTDDELYNRHGMEGGIGYDTSGGQRDAHSQRHDPEGGLR